MAASRMRVSTTTSGGKTEGGLGVLFFVLAAVVGAPSLTYPFGWDTSVHYYVGREWILRGAVPYRDSFDHKTPGIHAIHAVLIGVFGEGMWPIRLAELVAVLVMGVLAAWAVTERGRRPSFAVSGVAALATSLFYFGHFDPWNTAQCELSCAALVVASVAAARRMQTATAAAALSGLVAGAALVVKPVVVPLLVVAAAIVLARARREGKMLLGVAVGLALSLAVPLTFALYFALHGAFDRMVDALVGANIYYFVHERAAPTMTKTAALACEHRRHFSPFVPLLALASTAALIIAVWRKNGRACRTHLLSLSLAAGAVVAVVSQMKLYGYHWSIAAAPVAMAAAGLADEIARLRVGAPRFAPLALLAGALLVAFASSGWPALRWKRDAVMAARYALGRTTYDALVQHYDTPTRPRISELWKMSQWIDAHTKSDDLIEVRGVAAEIYALSRRRSPSRFFWTSFLDDPSRDYRRAAWRAEDEAALRAHPPAYAVLPPGSVAPVLTEMGYAEVYAVGRYHVLARSPN